MNDVSPLRTMPRIEFALAVREHDPPYESNLALSQALCDQGVQHHLAVWRVKRTAPSPGGKYFAIISEEINDRCAAPAAVRRALP
jgi:hypothetical protein